MTVRALMMCVSRNESSHHNPDRSVTVAAQVTLAPQYVQDEAQRPPENEIFGKATPSGQVTMFITNPHAHQQFVPGKFYYIDFTPVP